MSTYIRTIKDKRLVLDDELAFVLQVAHEKGGRDLCIALCLHVAYLTVGRPEETRELKREAITVSGLAIPVGKRMGAQPRKTKLMEWSPALQQAIDKALALQSQPSEYIFCNEKGEPYTRSGFGKMLANLMDDCELIARERGVPFSRFNLRDMRSMAITERLEAEDEEAMKQTKYGPIQNATGHTTDKTARKDYDSRKTKRAKPTK